MSVYHFKIKSQEKDRQKRDFIAFSHLKSIFENKELTYNEYFLDLSDVLTEEQLKKYQDCLLYYDKSLLEQLYQIDFSSGNNLEITFPDPTKPELMEDPVPIILCVSDSEKISYLYPNTDKEYGIVWIINGENRERTIEFLEFLLS